MDQSDGNDFVSAAAGVVSAKLAEGRGCTRKPVGGSGVRNVPRTAPEIVPLILVRVSLFRCLDG